MAVPSLEPFSDDWLIDMWANELLAILHNNMMEFQEVAAQPDENPLTQIDLEQVMVHELAHAWGLSHNGSLMEPYYPSLELMNQSEIHPDPEIEVLIQWQIKSL